MTQAAVIQTKTFESPLRLRPRMHAIARDFLADSKTAFALADAFGSPLNVMFPEVVDENIVAFKSVYKKHRISGRIFYTSKPNKSLAVIRQAALQDVSLDVSSEEALKRAVGCGFAPDRIEATGPKNLEYLTLAVQLGCIVNADNMAELAQITTAIEALGLKHKIRVFMRLSGFHADRVKFTSQDGTFGIHVDETEAAIRFLAAHKDKIDFLGFSYHWSMATEEQRVVAVENTLSLTLKAMHAGLNPRGVNIGGSFRIRYAEDRDEWLDYVDRIKRSLLDGGKRLTWNDGGLGYRNENGVIKGAPNFMDHAVEKPGAEDLDDLLSRPMPSFGNAKIGDVLSEHMLDLYIEPGRSLLDQTGITIARVNLVKSSVHGETLVALDMNRSNLHSTHQKLLTDPVILHRDLNACAPCPDGLFYMGNLCVSYDIIQYNKSFPDRLPQPGDLVAFINTAPYVMDFIESNTLHQNVGQKVAVIRDGNSFRWFQDEKYKPAVERIKP